jgi:hypothetical protein
VASGFVRSLNTNNILLAAAALACGALLFYPLRHASATGDDFLFIALGRHIDNPMVLLTQDVVGTYFFRPLVMLVWWITTAIFEDNAPAQYAFNVGVHVVNGLLIHALLRRLRIGAVPAALAALAFIVHPTAFSGSAWLSVRFDLCALAFGLAALLAAERYLEAPSAARLGAAAAAMLASLLSKEIGFAIAAAAMVTAAWPEAHHAARTRERRILAATLAGCAVAVLALRWIALRHAAEAVYLRDGLAATLWGGFRGWVAGLPGFLVVRQGNVAGILAWSAALATLLLFALAPRTRAAFDRCLARCATLGLVLMAVAAAAQAPVAKVSTIVPYVLDQFEYVTLALARLYYVALAGFAIFCAAVGEAIARAAWPAPAKRAMAAIVALAIVGLLASSRTIGREAAAFTDARNGVYLRELVPTLRARVSDAPGCKIYLIGMPPDAVYFRNFAQAAIMQALPRGHPLLACFILSENAPWYNLVANAKLPPDPARPLQDILVGGRPFAPLVVGNLTHYFLRIPDTPAVLDDPRATFLEYRDGRLEDVTAEVRARRRAVRFIDNRPPA